MKKGCLFDLDGTLVNSLTDLAMSTNRVLQAHHLPTHDISKYNQFVGNGVKKLMERALGDEHLDLLEQCLEEFHQDYNLHCLDHTLPYPKMLELIEKLKSEGIRLAVVTNKPQHLAVKIVEHLFPDTFVAVLGQQDAYPIKPHPESTHIALMTMRLSHHDCYFIGDSDVDMETGYLSDMETIGVAWGFRGQEELKVAGASFIAHTPMDIWRIIDEDRG